MAKTPTHVIGVDFGRYAIKAVSLVKRGGKRFVVNGYAIRKVEGEIETPEQIAENVMTEPVPETVLDDSTPSDAKEDEGLYSIKNFSI